MELHQVKYYLAVCETLNFTKAADLCDVSQPSLTRGIKKLETEFGGELFRRERARTHQTELGRMMYPVLSRCYEGADQALKVAHAFSSGEQAVIRIGICQSVEIDRIADALGELLTNVPRIELNIQRDHNDAVFAAMESGDIEFVVGSEPLDKWERVNSWCLFEEPFSIFSGSGSPQAHLESFSLANMAGETFLFEPFVEYSRSLKRQLERENISPRCIHTMTSRSDTFSFLRRNLGIAIIPSRTTTSEDIRAVPITDLALKCRVSICTVAGRQYSPAGAAFAKIIRSIDSAQKL